jgi:branched-chain amino acid transport system substrate-binding protein
MTFHTRAAKYLAAFLALMMLAAACSSEDSTDATDASSTDADADADAGGDDAEAAGDDDSESAMEATGDPIRIGAVSSNSGTNNFPESAVAAQLVFDRYNEAGGVDGRPIELIVVDDQDTAEGAAAAAKQLVEEMDVDALCCGGSIVDCTTNGGYYSENELQIIMGVAACVEAATAHPVNTGPFLPVMHALDFMLYDLGLTNLCTAAERAPIAEVFNNVFFPLWQDVNQTELNIIEVDPGEDFTPVVSKLAADGCDGVMVIMSEPGYQSFFQIVASQGLSDQMAFSMLTSGYSQSLLDASGDALEGVYAASEFVPYTGDPSAFPGEINDYLDLMSAAGETPTSFGQAGYVSANALIAALESIEGEINRESINAAVLALEYNSEMLGGPFTATGYIPPAQPNPFSLMVQVQDGEFERVNDFNVFPRAQG